LPRTPLGTMASKYGHGSGDISSFYRAAQRVSCPNRPFGRWADVGQRKNGRSGGNFLSTARCAWAVLGGIPSGWGQFGAVKKWAVVIGGLRRQLNALYSRVEKRRAPLPSPPAIPRPAHQRCARGLAPSCEPGHTRFASAAFPTRHPATRTPAPCKGACPTLRTGAHPIR
jgi:hypothetical protein